MHRGYVKLWRKSSDSGLMSNPSLWLFWTWCLLKASHKKTTVMVGYQNVDLEPGQFVFGRRKAASTLNLSEMVVRRCLESLKIAERITIKRTNKYSIITIINWDRYQSDECESNQQTNQQQTTQTTSNEPATSQQRATNKNEKEYKRNIKTFLSDSDEIRLANYLLNHIRKNNPESKQPNLQTWAKQFDLMLRIDNRSVDNLKSIIRFCQNDDFWKSNILSPKKLREHYDRLWLKMKSPQKNNTEQCTPCPPILDQSTRYQDDPI